MRRIRRSPAVALVAAGLGAAAAAQLGGCGAGDSVDPSAIASAAGATARAGGADITSTGSMRVPGLSRTYRYTSTGQTDATGRKARMVIDLSDFAKGGPQAGNPGDWKVETVFDFPSVYMRIPVLATQVGKPWIKEDILKFANAAGINVPGLFQGSQNPREFVDYLRAVKSDVKRVGTDTVRGVKTTHYKATVDLRRYPDKLPPAQRPQARAAIERLIQLTGNASYPVEVWLDSRQRTRRLKLSYSMKMGTTGPKLILDQTTELYDFGVKPQIQPPPADQVKDITDLAAKQAQRSGLGQ